jgi:integral membrane sensor domain MASE1
MMVYTIAVACSFWYYNVTDRNYFTTAYKWLFKYSFGSVVFASILIAVITFARMIVQTKRRSQKNIAAAVCLCLVECCLRNIEALLRILNHNTVIVMAVTG